MSWCYRPEPSPGVVPNSGCGPSVRVRAVGVWLFVHIERPGVVVISTRPDQQAEGRVQAVVRCRCRLHLRQEGVKIIGGDPMAHALSLSFERRVQDRNTRVLLQYIDFVRVEGVAVDAAAEGAGVVGAVSSHTGPKDPSSPRKTCTCRRKTSLMSGASSHGRGVFFPGAAQGNAQRSGDVSRFPIAPRHVVRLPNGRLRGARRDRAEREHGATARAGEAAVPQVAALAPHLESVGHVRLASRARALESFDHVVPRAITIARRPWLTERLAEDAGDQIVIISRPARSRALRRHARCWDVHCNLKVEVDGLRGQDGSHVRCEKGPRQCCRGLSKGECTRGVDRHQETGRPELGVECEPHASVDAVHTSVHAGRLGAERVLAQDVLEGRQGAGLDDDVRDEVEADLRGVARIQQVDVTRCERPVTEGFKAGGG